MGHRALTAERRRRPISRTAPGDCPARSSRAASWSTIWGCTSPPIVPMQARTGDYALFFRKAAVEITFEGDRYLVVPQAAILALVRDELDELMR